METEAEAGPTATLTETNASVAAQGPIGQPLVGASLARRPVEISEQPIAGRQAVKANCSRHLYATKDRVSQALENEAESALRLAQQYCNGGTGAPLD